MLLAMACASASAAAQTPAWSARFVARLEALALLQTLNAELLSHDSATLTLEHWCALHRLAASPRVVAVRVAGMEKQPSPEQREELGVAPAEPIRYRRVRLLCGTALLSEADNWYVPSRLTPEMNRLLDTIDTPFGKVVLALHFRRHTLSSKLLWLALPEGWEMNAAAANDGAADFSLPPKLLAAVYGILATDPAVHFDKSVTDNVGQTGVGFYVVEGVWKYEIMINPSTYAYMGVDALAVRSWTRHWTVDGVTHTGIHIKKGQGGWTDLVASGIVQRPGQKP